MNEEIQRRARQIVLYGNSCISVIDVDTGKVNLTAETIKYIVIQAQEILDILQSSEEFEGDQYTGEGASHLEMASKLIDQALFRTDIKDLELKVTFIRQSVDKIIRHLMKDED